MSQTRFQAAVEFHNRLRDYEPYDASHLLHPNATFVERSDVIEWIKDFKMVDGIYLQYVDTLDYTLKLRGEMIREPFYSAIIRVLEKDGAVDGRTDLSFVGALMDEIGLSRLISFVDDMRDIALEQLSRYRVIYKSDIPQDDDA